MASVSSSASMNDAYHRIKNGILECRYQPGQKLSEVKLAGELRLWAVADSQAAAKAMRQHIGNIAISFDALPARGEGAEDAS